MRLRATHLGSATVLLEIGGLRLLTDPAFDPSGSHYSWAPFGGNSTKLEDPAGTVEALGPLDAVLITHAQHDDNLDPSGRKLLPTARRVLTTRPSARRLGGKAEGLRDWETAELTGPSGQRIRVTATPARHGPPLSLPFVGKVIGFVLQWEEPGVAGPSCLYISGDTVWFGGVAEVARRFEVGIALLHMGQAMLPVTGPFRLTMNGAAAARAAKALRARLIVPVHYDGWTHFTEPRADAEQAFSAAGLSDRVRWLPKGKPVELQA